MSNELIETEESGALTLRDLSPMVAAELAAGLSDPKTLRERYGLSMAQWKSLSTNPAFRQMLAEAVTKFKGDLNAGNRITLKAEVLLEDVLPDLYHIAKSKEIPSSDRINAVKQLAELSGRSGKKDQAANTGGSTGFVLNINVGKGQGITIDAKKVQSNDDNG